MNSIAPRWTASVLLKAAMAVTGLGMAAWLTLHMLGNLTYFAGAELMNSYALKLRASGLLWPMRLVLLAACVVHVVCAIVTSRRAYAARRQSYRMRRARSSGPAARTMRIGGALLLAFLVFHVGQMYGAWHPAFVAGDVHHNLLRVVARPLHAALYIGATALLALHLAHGLASSLITLGVFVRSRERRVRAALRGWAWLITLGFAIETLAPFALRG